jgi:OOP family OmpA-OmpF porin
MNYRLKVAVLLFSLMITSVQLFAQSMDGVANPFRTWSIGIHTGISTTYALLSNNKTHDFTSPDPEISYGGYIKYQIANSFGLQADFMTGQLKADHAIQLNSDKVPIYSQFDTKLNWSAGLSGSLILAHINLKNEKGLMQPYITFGGGLLSYTPVLHSYYSDAVVPTFNTKSGFYVPVGIGLKINLAKGVNLDLGYQVNFMSSDDLDGYVYGSNDMYSYTHIGLEFALGNSSKPQLATQGKHNHTNGKYIPWVRNSKVPAPVQPTPAQPTPVDSTQINHDQLKQDLDSTNARLARLSVDSDGDGVPDVKDKCPNTPPGTKVDSTGCPITLPAAEPEIKYEVKEEDQTAVKMAIQNLEFFPGTSIIHGYSLNGLDKVAELLKSKKIRLRLEGYTDSSGKPDDNLKLSKERAEAVKLYLVGRGVKPAQIETVGYGAANPVASNKTASGRRLNRRVEFILL